MTDQLINQIDINVETHYIEEQSLPEENRYVFAYTITIHNNGEQPAKLLNRHWIITDGDGNTQEVRGEGVVGETPHIGPGDYFRYTSGTVLETPVGTMEGSYRMRADDGSEFEAMIPVFTLSLPHTLH
ncbi:MAG: Co2+/Mg2+ efflux protein ApaG [Gammaproteobacteria bacterium]|nr:Co2+/Mg2+ efflux protein ApaG [Gammaproteobacteria bacterium]MCW8840890.1 Co2+/Mg2+ efflux protein ApaG [Gammaproteobacteria bacterium]MCW8959807.1 Co2+/Mg2+ efflux protein ApaG [Gammaproteobacteria bacterium]MCW8971868.1 Co2+/Mg2+ efflux protein ApaG [Gammaproteobacteria bacterium]MCW8994129.1 Co2+/Mg2+ efflux protein ApaG [Gammaproteobacteria bacterium]